VILSPSLNTSIILFIVPPSVDGTVEGQYRHHLIIAVVVVAAAAVESIHSPLRLQQYSAVVLW
jgi:hypothetical protein